jgi:hypothetical protein
LKNWIWLTILILHGSFKGEAGILGGAKQTKVLGAVE